MSNKGPGLFSNIGNKARDILYKDYTFDRKFSISTQTEDGLALTSTALQKETGSISDVAVQYKYKNASIHVKVDTESKIATTVTLTDIMPSTKMIASMKLPDYNSGKIATTVTLTDIMPSTKTIASMKLPDYNSGKLEVQYFHEHAAIASSLTLNKSPIADISATFGTPNTVLGIEACYNTSAGDFTKYNAGISMTKPEFCTSVFLADKGDLLKISYVHYLDQVKATTVVEFTNRFSKEGNTLTVGGSFAVDDLTLIKLKLNNQGNFGAVLQHEFKPKSILTMAAEFDYNSLDTNPKFGLGLTLKP